MATENFEEKGADGAACPDGLGNPDGEDTPGSQSGEMYRAGPPVLDARLLAAAQMVPSGSVVADIGCDHGKLAVWLAHQARASRVIAVDANPMPLAKARALVRQFGIQDKVQCRLGDGLAAVQPGEADTVVVAGLSAETIMAILEKAPWLRQHAPGLVLVPTSRHERLRGWLCENGFALLQEKAVLEKGRSYAVMLAKYTGEGCSPSALFCQMGLLPLAYPKAGEKEKAAIRAYAQKRLGALRGQLYPEMPEDARGACEALIREVEACLH